MRFWLAGFGGAYMSACCMEKSKIANIGAARLSGHSVTVSNSGYTDFTPLLGEIRFDALPEIAGAWDNANRHVAKLNARHPAGFGLLEIDAYLTEYAHGRENATVKNLGYGLRNSVIQAMGLDYRLHHGKRTVVDETFRPYVTLKPRKARRPVPSPREIMRVFVSARPRVASVVEILFQTGLRISELCNLKISDFDPQPTEDGTGVVFRVKNKGGDIKVVKMRLATFERAVKAFYGCVYLIESRPGKKYSRQGLADLVKCGTRRVLGRAYPPHSLRHAHADYMMANHPGKLKGILDNGGWANAEVFISTYNHVQLNVADLPSLDDMAETMNAQAQPQKTRRGDGRRKV